MIPKIIHYCWFSGEPFDEKTKKCIETWKKTCPDYEIRECNALNFDMGINDFVKEAYEAKKWAFVADFARLYLLYHYGGVYMDGDVELVKNIDIFLKRPAFIGQERKGWVSAGIIGAEAGNDFIKTCLDYYKGKHFLREDGTFNQITNVQIITHNLFESYGLLLNGKKQRLGNLLYIYPVDYFSPKDSITGEIHATDNTYAIHHFNNAWKDKTKAENGKGMNWLTKVLGPSAALFLSELKPEKREKGYFKNVQKKLVQIKMYLRKKKILRIRKLMEPHLYD